jgi:hypothetical protein
VRFKGTFGLLIVFAGLGAYVYFTEFRGAEERQKQEAAKKRLFEGEAKDVTEITLNYEGRTVSAVRKDEKTWEITAPAGLESDSEAWEQLASSFVQIEKDEVVSAEKTDLVPYGLDNPAISVTAKLKGNTAGVLFGNENPRKTFHYAKRQDNDEVFLSSTSWGSAFKKSLTDLRNKKVLDFETADIDLIRVSAAGKPEIELQKSGMDWMVKKPVETLADIGEVSGFLSSIQFSRTSTFADDADTKATGIDAPVARVVLHDAKAGTDRVLLFGKSPEKDKFYAKDQSRTPVFILGTEIYEKTQQALLAWRDKAIVRLSEPGISGGNEVDELEITRGAEKLLLKKTGVEWKAPDGQKASESKVFSMLNSIESARATQILDNPGGLAAFGLDKPRLTATLKSKGKELATVSFGRDSTNPAGVYVRAAGPVATIAKDVYDAFNVKMSDLAETPPAPANPAK